ncbi:MAG: ABC transporter ATP-binding protein [Roseiflexaceae bacterium]|nr:ABC transporter ATP-binding protein [Roseiflexaceae bacterium]
MEAVIHTEELTKQFGRHIAVDRLTLTVGPGEVFGFLGPNGAGKTTTIAMLLGLIRPTSGRAVVLGHDVQREPQAALARVGAMIEAPAFYPYLSAYDNLLVLVRMGGLPVARIDQALAAVELTSRGRDQFRTFSQGMRQRLAIAAALLADPQLILLDEPTNGLDPAGQHEIRELIRNLAAAGRTIFLSGHQLHEIEQLCGRVAILKQGRLIAEGPVADLLHQGRGVLVRIQGEVAQALEILRGLPWVGALEQRDGAIVIDAPPERTPEITAILAGAGVAIQEIRAHSETLEDVFLRITSE